VLKRYKVTFASVESYSVTNKPKTANINGKNLAFSLEL
jgi:hypothetical protein